MRAGKTLKDSLITVFGHPLVAFNVREIDGRGKVLHYTKLLLDGENVFLSDNTSWVSTYPHNILFSLTEGLPEEGVKFHVEIDKNGD